MENWTKGTLLLKEVKNVVKWIYFIKDFIEMHLLSARIPKK